MVYAKEGGQGGPLCLADNTSGLRLIERAIKENWPIPEKYKPKIVERQCKIATNPKSPDRAASVAARVLVAMEQQNQKAAELALEVSGLKRPGEHVTNQQINIYGADVRDAARTLLAEEDYADFIRNRAVAGDIDAGAVCQIRESGNGHAVENGTAHGGAGPGANGHRNGRE